MSWGGWVILAVMVLAIGQASKATELIDDYNA
jgi:hypothetical protein